MSSILLTDKTRIRRALRRVTAADAGRRVILVAYVGADPLTYIADPTRIAVYCSDNPVGTNPDGISELIEHGATVYFCSRLHAKIFWSANAGAVVGSPNLSSNALGDGGLFESLVDVDDIDIDKVISDLSRHSHIVEVTPKLLEAFRRVSRRVRGQVQPAAVKAKTTDTPSFESWLRNPYRKPFSIVTFTRFDAPAFTASELAQIEAYNETHDTGRGDRSVDDITFNGPVVSLPENEDVLCVHITSAGDVRLQQTNWLRYELRIESRTGRGGKGVRTRLVQVRPRIERVPFEPRGATLKATLAAYFARHPFAKKQEGVVVASGSAIERNLIVAAIGG